MSLDILREIVWPISSCEGVMTRSSWCLGVLASLTARGDFLVVTESDGETDILHAISHEDACLTPLVELQYSWGVVSLDVSPSGELWGQNAWSFNRWDPASGDWLDGFDTPPQIFSFGGITLPSDDEAYAVYGPEKIAAWDLNTGAATIMVEDVELSVQAMHLHDGQLFLIATMPNAIWRVETTGELTMVARYDEGIGRVEGISELDGQVYVIARSDDFVETSLFRIDLLTGATTKIGALPSNVYFGALATIPGCIADINRDWELNVLDFVAFQLAWLEQMPVADCDGDGEWSVLDFACFQAAFMTGCG